MFRSVFAFAVIWVSACGASHADPPETLPNSASTSQPTPEPTAKGAGTPSPSIESLYAYFTRGWIQMEEVDVAEVPVYLSVPRTWFEQVYARAPGYSGIPPAYQRDEDATPSPLAAYLLYGMDRSPARLNRLFNQFKADPFRYLSEMNYIRHNIHHTVNGLLTVHRQFSAFDTFSEYLSRYYALLSQPNRPLFQSDLRFAELTASYASVLRAYEEREAGQRVTLQNGVPVHWALSFWARRHHEGNRDAVLDILTQVQRLYQPAVSRFEQIEKDAAVLSGETATGLLSSTSDYDIVPYGFGEDGSFYYCDVYNSSTVTGADYAMLIQLTPDNNRVELAAVHGVVLDGHPLAAIMRESQTNWVQKWKQQGVIPIRPQLLEFPDFVNNDQYAVAIESVDDSARAALYLQVNNVRTRTLTTFTLPEFVPCDSRAECLDVRGYYRSPDKNQLVVVVTYYIGWENVLYYLFSMKRLH